MMSTPSPQSDHRPLVTIDGASTRDIDDAITVSRLADAWKVTVAIADPTRFVRIGSSVDQTARELGATVYAGEATVRRMLPARISEGEGSLVAGADRHAFVFTIDLDPLLAPARLSVDRRKVRVDRRLTYDDVPEVMQQPDDPVHAMLRDAVDLSQMLLRRRRSQGGMALYDLASLVFLDEDGQVTQLRRKEEVAGYVLVQEMMVLANSAIAQYAVAHQVPVIFRTHEPRDAGAPSGPELALVIDQWATISEDQRRQEARRVFDHVMGKARYSAAAARHHALNKPVYGHFTSPLRRYADLANLRELAAHLAGTDPAYGSDERAALAEQLNAAAEARKEERARSFKEVVQARAEGALARGNLQHLGEPELGQAWKLDHESGEVSGTLATEIATRLTRNQVSDRLAQRIVGSGNASTWPADLQQAFQAWVRKDPARALRLLNHLQQVAPESALEVTVSASAPFTAEVALAQPDGDRQTFTATGPSKREAHHAASINALLWYVGVPLLAPAPDPHVGPERPPATGVASATTTTVNPKGQLLELCQRQGWSAPTLDVRRTGPDHAPAFCGSGTLLAGSLELTVTAKDGKTKKDAEASLCGQLLKALADLAASAPQPAPAVAPEKGQASGNPIGELQECAQRAGKTLPSYSDTVLSLVPPAFRVSVRVSCPVVGDFVGEARTKQEAKRIAAAAALAATVAAN